MDSRTKMVGVVSSVVLMGLVSLNGCESITGKSTRQTPSDASITATVQAKLKNDSYFGYVPPLVVATDHGVVHLSGAVPTPYHRDRVGSLAREVEGVTEVDNDLTILPWR